MLKNLNKTVDKPSLKHSHTKRILVILLLVIVLLGFPIAGIVIGAKQAAHSGKLLVAAYKNQNFDEMQKDLTDTTSSLKMVDTSLNFMFWLKAIPVLGGYYGDMASLSSAGMSELKILNQVMTQIAPYKKDLGFNNQPLPGQDRIVQLVKIWDKISPNLNQYSSDLQQASNSVQNIDVTKYPEQFRGVQVKALVQVAKDFITGAATGIQKAEPALQLAPDALGMNSPKTYLLLFQNDKELRPTGGFISAYAALKIDKGRISATASDDIYHLDEKLLEACKTKVCNLTPPDPIVKYLPEETGKARTTWSMRDSNISPDLPTSMKQFEQMYQLLGEGLPFDGIITIDTQVVQDLISITGPIDVYGTKYSDDIDPRCNCANVVYEMESYVEIAAQGSSDRKAVLGVLMQELLARALGSDVEKTPEFIDTAVSLANQKHILFYMHNNQLEQSLAALDWTGQIKPFNGDYLHINDANFAGGKSNLYVEQVVTQEINIKDNKVTKKITIDYSNPQKFDSWLNGINRDYVRFYVPEGSKLISSNGSEVAMNTLDDLGKTVFDGFITVRPQNSRKLEVEYEIPYNPSGKYNLLIQKQPGAKDFRYIIKLNGNQVADFTLDSDKEFEFSL